MSSIDKREALDFLISGAGYASIMASGAEWWVIFPLLALMMWNYYDGMTRDKLEGL